MPNISVKDVPEALAEALRQRAARNHRSLQGELMALIQRAVEPESAASAKLTPDNRSQAPLVGDQTSAQRRSSVVGFDRFGNPILRQGWKTVEQVVAELKAKYPDGPVPGQGSSIDMIREDRDSR